MSSGNPSKDTKGRFSEILRRVYHFHRILPTSYYAHDVVLVEKHALGGFADIHRGKYAGQSVRVKAFRMQNAMSTELVKHVRTFTISEDAGSDALLNRGSTLKLYDGNTSRIRIYYRSLGSRRCRPRFLSLAPGCQMAPSSSIPKEMRVQTDCSW